MTASLETLVVAVYLFADEEAIPRPGPKGAITDAELVALAVAQAAMGVPSDRQFLGLVGKVLPGWFPHLPSQSQYNRRLRRLAPLIASVQLRVSELIARSELRIADGTVVIREGHRARELVIVVGGALLATRAGGAPLSVGHGFPARLVAPGRRGFWWVKWVDRIELRSTPWWWQPPFPVT